LTITFLVTTTEAAISEPIEMTLHIVEHWLTSTLCMNSLHFVPVIRWLYGLLMRL